MQLLEESKTPLALANAEVENLKQELIQARRQELSLGQTIDKEKALKDQQIRATSKQEVLTKEVKGALLEEKRAVEQGLSEIDQKGSEVVKLRKALFSMEKDRERLGSEVTEQRTSRDDFSLVFFFSVISVISVVVHISYPLVH